MSVFLPTGCRTYFYDFTWRGQRHSGSTQQTDREDAKLVEAKIKIRLRQQAGGIAPFDPADTPRFEEWARVFLGYQKKFTDRPDLVKRALVVVLEFWGAKPQKARPPAAVPRQRRGTAPYHDLCLGHAIADPSWIRKFDDWITARGVSGSTRNSYLSALSGMYRVAMQPEYRADTNILNNPFRDIRRSPTRTRTVALEPAVIVRWIHEASYHVALATTIAALAPKLRLRTILDLRWSEHFDDDLTRMTIAKHKTARTGAPQVTPISPELRAVLLDAKSRQPKHAKAVILYRGKPVASIKRGARRAAEAIGLQWGARDGVTFHTIRHSIATLLASMGLSEAIRKEIMGHREIRTTQKYTHLAAAVQVAPHHALSLELPVRELMLAKPRPKTLGKPLEAIKPKRQKWQGKTRNQHRRRSA